MIHFPRRISITTAALAVLGLAASLPGRAQTSNTGALTAAVTDATGAAIVGATVTLTNPGTGLSRSQTTGANGSSTFDLLPPGSYTLTFSAPGFAKAELPNVIVNVTETHQISQRLAVGAQEQQVTVEAAVEALQTENATLGGVVNNRAISDLPLQTRNFTQIMGLSAGVNVAVTNAAALGRGFVSIYSNGQEDISNTFQIDGVTVNEYGGGNATGGAFFGEIPTPSPDALQEFKVQTAQYDASFGRNSGAQVNIVTKTGTNDIHGSLFEFFRNEDLNANDFFRNRSGQPRGLLRQNQYGGTFGGRIVRDKLFYFLSYQGTKQTNGVSSTGASTVTLPAQLTNDRSAAALGAAFCPANNPVINTRTFAGGAQVACDGSNINPVALAILNFRVKGGGYAIPTPTSILNPGAAQAVGFAAFSIPGTFSENQAIGNLDYVLSPKENLALKEEYSIAPQTTYLNPSQPPGSGAATLSGSQLQSVKLTSVITNRMINEARASLFYLRASNNTIDQIKPSLIGLTPINPVFLDVMPIITVPGLFSIGGGSTDGSHAPQQTYEYSDQWSYTTGRQTIRAGADVQRVDYNIDVTGIGRGTLTFNTFSDFLLGESAAQNGSPTGLSNLQSSTGTALPLGGSLNRIRANQWSMFVQDDFKVTPRFTLNLGLRWEYDGTGYDVDPANGGGNASWALDQTVPVPPASGTFAGYTVASNFNGVLPPGVVRRPLNLLTNGHAPFDDFAPRIGLAWQPTSSGKFVVRAGFGTFYQVMQGNIWLLELNNNPPIAAKDNLSGAANGMATLGTPYNPPVVRGFYPTFLRTPTSLLAQQSLDGNLLTPFTYDYNFTTQYAFTPTLSLEVGFVGARGEHLVTGTVLNTPLIATPSNPVNCGGPAGCITTNTSTNAAQRVPVLGIGPNGISYGTNAGDSDYNALQATVRKTLSHGLQIQAAYTWDRDFTDVAGTTFTGGYAGTVYSNDPLSRAQQHGPADFDRTQRLVVNYFYQVPQFHQNQGFAGRLLSDWGVSGVTVVQSGQGMTLIDTKGGGIYGFTPANSVRAQTCPGFTYGQLLSSGGVEQNLNGFFNLNAVADTIVTAANPACAFPIVGMVNGAGGATGFGNTGRGIVVGPGQFNWDLSVIKNIRVGGLRESGNLQLRAEFFNALNHPQFANPSTVVNQATFGQITSTTVAPRIIQMVARYSF